MVFTRFVYYVACLVLLLIHTVVLGDDDKVMLNFVNADIEATIKSIALITGKNFILDPRVKGTVSIMSASPVSKADVYPIMLSALRLQGFSVVEDKHAIKIVPEIEAKHNSVHTSSAEKLSIHGDAVITQIYPLQHESAVQLLPILRPLVTPNHAISAYNQANILVITDYAENIHRLNKLIARIDQPNHSVLTVLALEYASAVDVANTIHQLMPDVTASAQLSPMDVLRKTLVVADMRSNSLLIRGANNHHLIQIRQLVQQLDTRLLASGNIHVVYLKNAEAHQLAVTLRAILGGTSTAPTASSPSLASNMLPNHDPRQPKSNDVASLQLPSSELEPALNQGYQQVAIQADATTNALIITAPDNIYNNLRAVIDQLDTRRAQVYVEALIAEVKMDKQSFLGIQWLVGNNHDKLSTLGSSSFSSNTAVNANLVNITQAAGAWAKQQSPVALPSGLVLGVFNGKIRGGKVPSLAALATALVESGDANILSTPNLLTLDNEVSTIKVGQKVPFATGTQPSTASNPNPFTTYSREDVGITLKIKPQISEGGSVTLQVYQEVSSVDKNTPISAGGPTTNTRTIETKVLVDDGQTIVLGGLIQDDVGQVASKVPLLGDIPLLGSLFRFDSQNQKRTNLMVFLRPVILRDGHATQALSNRRYQQLQHIQQEFNEKHEPSWLPKRPDLQLPDLPTATPSEPVDSQPSASP